MDEQENTAEDELDLETGTDTKADEVADTEATDTDEQETESSDEQEQDTLDLESKVEKPEEQGKAELAKEKLVNDWTRKVESGSKSLDDIPEDQAWLRPLVEAKSGTKELDDDAIDRKLDERENSRRYDSLVSELNGSVTKEQKSTLEGKYKTLRDKGLSKLDALELSMEVAGVDLGEMALDAKRYAARMRTPGNYKKGEVDLAALEKKEGFGAVAKKGDPDKIWKDLKGQLDK